MPESLMLGGDRPSGAVRPVEPRFRSCKGGWFAAGLVLGAALTLGAVLLLTRGGAPSNMRTRDHASAAALARLVARPLVPEGQSEPQRSDAEVLAALSSVLSKVDEVAAEDPGLAPIAREYGDALRALQPLLAEPPSAQPLVRAGLETWRRSMEDDRRGFILGLLGVGSELSRFGELTEKVNAIHVRVVACRLRIAEVMAETAPPEAPGDMLTARFEESRSIYSTKSDTLFLKNISGTPLAQVAVLMELTGASGETFTNCFYTDTWAPDQTVLAVCRSERPGRETVVGVKRVRYRVFSAQRTSRPGDLTF